MVFISGRADNRGTQLDMFDTHVDGSRSLSGLQEPN